ncbi:hypothetical protein BJG92_01667 [Arthrobacter sp. SO5]|uniref:type II toxin-antitoxin system Y4mF family antitoxin n=1 Tax=Arthrobacter sp. SO5 TaxID=1897055 RepID=UPI001E30AAF5|nr:type II toxin-antitoxin system Y4mF family antitoxin [Arthrobacter sp. SO5]MCB5274140.1 hypothetical protein [Arthrobacter sp. SO5]
MAESFQDRLAAGVRARRGTLRLSQRDLAELAGVSERFVRFVEQGKPSVQLDLLLALLATLGLELQLTPRTSSAARALAGGPGAATHGGPGAATHGGPAAVELPEREATALAPAPHAAPGPAAPRP